MIQPLPFPSLPHSFLLTSSSMAASAKPPRPKLACFSFAAYAKTVIDHLKTLQIPVLPGLTEQEFNSVESTFNFSFPPDLRSILQEGLPIGPGFPNWRSSSFQQLHILLNLPKFSLLKEVKNRNFWFESWGDEPDDPNEALAMAKRFLDRVPILVPIYRNCYIPSVPNMAGNPVFYINGGKVKVFSFDLAGFFQNHEYSKFTARINPPAWAATEARKVLFWTDVPAARKRVKAAREKVNDGVFESGLEGYLEEVTWKLREGGWREEEVMEMMMMMDGGDQIREESVAMIEREKVAEILLGGGWSRDDVMYSLGIEDVIPDDDSMFEINLQIPMRVSHVDCKNKGSSLKELMQLQKPQFMFAPHRNLIL